jgi:transposase
LFVAGEWVGLCVDECHVLWGDLCGGVWGKQDERIEIPIRIWDGASYHRSQAIKGFLASVNEGLDEEQWRVTCLRFAPNDPTQNPLEDIWLAAKRFLRTYYHRCPSFKVAKIRIHWHMFDFPKLFTYGRFSQVT